MANNCFHFNEFDTSEVLVDTLSSKIIKSLEEGIAMQGYATLALSGGSTPKKLLNRLSNVDIAWEKVRVTLVDERWVDSQSTQSNEKLIHDNLLINNAKRAKFYGLKADTEFAKESVNSLALSMKNYFNDLDVVVLGMGLDAHTASFFPFSDELEHALSTDDLACATTASVEPKERITLSRSFLLSASQLILHIEGTKKKEVFFKASKLDDISNMPIISMMQQEKPLLEVYYAD